MNDTKKLQILCDEVHAILQQATAEFVPPKAADAVLVRRKMLVLTFGVCTALAEQNELDSDELYYQYLRKGGLTSHWSRIVVERARLQYSKLDYGQICMQLGQALVENKQQNESDASIAEKIYTTFFGKS